MAKAESTARGELTIVRLTPSRIDDMQEVLRGTWGSACYCMFPRLTAKTRRETPVPPGRGSPNRRLMTALARVDGSKATPRVDDVPVWVIPCITVHGRVRGRGVAQALIRAAVAYAAEQGAPAVEAYPRESSERVHDDFAFIGTEALFRKAGFRRIRGSLQPLPRGWTPRVTMRVACTSKTSRRPRGRSAAG